MAAPSTEDVMRILIAEDDLVSRSMLESLLIKWGHSVVVTCDGPAAWQALQREDAPPMAILDWMMPGLDGLEVARRARAQESTRSLYIIMLTALGSKNHIIQGLEAGADDYMAKPFDPQELRARVNVGERIIKLQTELSERLRQLEISMAQVKTLTGLLPICAYCKKVRNDSNYWEQVESFISEHSQVQFSHGVCPDCYERYLRPEIDAIEEEHRNRK